MWQALGCMCPHWGAALWVPVAWLVLPDVRMHGPATSLLFNRWWCFKPHQTVIQATRSASHGRDAECGSCFLFGFVSPFVNTEERLPAKPSSGPDREGREKRTLPSLLCSSWLKGCLFGVPQLSMTLNAQRLEVGRTQG